MIYIYYSAGGLGYVGLGVGEGTYGSDTDTHYLKQPFANIGKTRQHSKRACLPKT